MVRVGWPTWSTREAAVKPPCSATAWKARSWLNTIDIINNSYRKNPFVSRWGLPTIAAKRRSDGLAIYEPGSGRTRLRQFCKTARTDRQAALGVRHVLRAVLRHPSRPAR